MQKIIRCDHYDVIVGNDTDGSAITVPAEKFNWTPKVGDIVEVYKTENDFIVNLKCETLPKGEKTINKYIFILLYFLSGGLGIQYFYAGLNSKGVRTILCCTIGAFLIIPIFICAILMIIDVVKVAIAPNIPNAPNGEVIVSKIWPNAVVQNQNTTTNNKNSSINLNI